MPFSLTTWPRNVILLAAKQHLLGFSLRFTSLSLHRTISRCWRCFAQLSLWTLRSSTNTFRNLLLKSLKTYDIVLVNVLVAFFRPNGMTVQSYNLVLVSKAVFFTSSEAIRICQKLDCKSRAVNHVELPN